MSQMKEYPHLPLLEIEQCLSVFVNCHISFNMLATVVSKGESKPGLLPYSRQSLFLWRKGRNPHPTALEQVNVLAYQALACLRTKAAPFAPRAKMENISEVLRQVDLNKWTAEGLLPKGWLPAQESATEQA